MAAPETISAAARSLLAHHEATLPEVERRLADGTYRRGPRRGQPFDASYQARLERWAGNMRRGITRYREVAETAEQLAAAGVVDAGWVLR